MVSATQNEMSRELSQVIACVLTKKGVAVPAGRTDGASWVERGVITPGQLDDALGVIGESVLACPGCGAVYTGLNPVEGKSYRCKKCAGVIAFPGEINLEAREMRRAPAANGDASPESVASAEPAAKASPEPAAKAPVEPSAKTPAEPPAPIGPALRSPSTNCGDQPVGEGGLVLRSLPEDCGNRAVGEGGPTPPAAQAPAPTSGLPKRSAIARFFSFDAMVLPLIIKVLFVLGMIGIILAGLAFPFAYAFGADGFSILRLAGGAVASLVGTVFGIIAWRVICEGPIVLFKIHEDLLALREVKR